MLLVHFLFVYFARVNFCPFSLPLGVRGWLRLLIVVLPVLFFINFLLLMHFCFHSLSLLPEVLPLRLSRLF